MRKVTIPMTTLVTNNEQSGAVPITVTANGNSRAYGEFARMKDAVFLLDVTDASGAGEHTLTVTIEAFDEAADIWREVLEWDGITAVGTQDPEVLEIYFKRYRAKWELVGDGAEFTFALSAIARG